MSTIHNSTSTSIPSEDIDQKTLQSSVSLTECNSCHALVVSNTFGEANRFQLKPGENLFDFEGSTASTQHLSSFLHHLSASNVYRLFFAYTQILQYDTHRCSTSFTKYGNHNRFSDIPCTDETRVRVRHISEDHDYIHANWVDGYRESRKFIITQAPLPHTRSQFWKMLWQEKSLIVVSMIQMFDVTGAEWTPTYIPKKTGEIYRVDDMELLHCGTRRVTYKGEERSLLHLCYFSWGYRGTPKKPTEVLNFIADINYNRELLIKQAVGAGWLKSNESSPIVIHCLAGTAKSAVIAALDICLRKLDDTAKRKCGPLVDVEDVVLRLRTQRAMAIQKPEQYLFIHLAVLEYAVRQRYVADEMYNDFDLEGFFYERKSTDEGGRKTQEKKADPNNDNSKGIDQDTK